MNGRVLHARLSRAPAAIVPECTRAHVAVQVLTALAAIVGCGGGAVEERLLLVGAPVAEVDAPASAVSSVALVSEGVACVVDSYFVRIHCLHRDGRPAEVWGRQGEGPGEFASIQSVVRGPRGSVAVVDGSLNRLTAFRPTGERVSETRLPSLFTPKGPMDAVLDGHYLRIDGAGLEFRQVQIDEADGETTWERAFPRDLAYPGCDDAAASDGLQLRGSAFGAATPDGGVVFTACDGQLVLFPDRDGDSTVALQRPAYAGELPNQRDVDEFVDARRGSFRGDLTDADVEAFRRKAKQWSFLGPMVDDSGRLWVVTSRDRDEFSYFELYVRSNYVGTVRVSSRVVGFDVLGDALAVVTERRPLPDDTRGIDQRAVAWYDIAGLPS